MPNQTNEFIRSLLCKDERLLELEDYAKHNSVPIILPESAAFLRQICLLKAPKKVLEIGTGIGYSGHIILQNSSAHLFTIDHNEEFLKVAKNFFLNSNLLSRVSFLYGDESDVISNIDGQFDLIFMDGAKSRYLHHLPYLKKMLCSGGILLADNVLFKNMVSGEIIQSKKKTIVNSLKEFLNQLCNDSDFITSILPVGDGMSLSILK